MALRIPKFISDLFHETVTDRSIPTQEVGGGWSTIAVSAMWNGDNILYVDRVTGTVYRIIIMDGEVLKEEVDPATFQPVSGGLSGLITGF